MLQAVGLAVRWHRRRLHTWPTAMQVEPHGTGFAVVVQELAATSAKLMYGTTSLLDRSNVTAPSTPSRRQRYEICSECVCGGNVPPAAYQSATFNVQHRPYWTTRRPGTGTTEAQGPKALRPALQASV